MQNRRLNKDQGCCSVNFLEYVLFIFNFLFYIAGISVLGVGLWTWFCKTTYVSLLVTHTYVSATYLLIGTGVLVFFVGVIGCIGVLKENRPCLLVYTFMLLLIFILEAIAGILAFIYAEQIHRELSQSLRNTVVTKYGVVSEISAAVDDLHNQFNCCGATNFQDWRESKWYTKVNSPEVLANREPEAEARPLRVPRFCCRSQTPNCGIRDHPSNIYYDGCIIALTDEIREHSIILSAVGLGVSTVQIFGMFISCCLYVKLKDFDDYRRYKSQSSYYR